MKKQLLNVFGDAILNTEFIPEKVKNEKTGYMEPVYIDKDKGTANGNYHCTSVTFYRPDYGNDGYQNGKFTQVELQISDVKKLMEVVNQIESQKNVVAIVGDDLPF